MGYTNSVKIFHGDTTFLLQEEIPHVMVPFLDDIPVKGLTSWYQDEHREYETIPENKGICCFIWEHLHNINRVIQQVKHVSKLRMLELRGNT